MSEEDAEKKFVTKKVLGFGSKIVWAFLNKDGAAVFNCLGRPRPSTAVSCLIWSTLSVGPLGTTTAQVSAVISSSSSLSTSSHFDPGDKACGVKPPSGDTNAKGEKKCLLLLLSSTAMST